MYFQDIKLLGLKKKERRKKRIYSIRQEKKGDSRYRAQYLRLWRLSFNASRYEDNRDTLTDGRMD